MSPLDDDPRWDTFGLLMEAYRSLDAAIERDTYGTIPYDRQIVDLLIRLARTPSGQLRPSAIAVALATTRPHTTILIDRAESAGLVDRLPEPADGRSFNIALTAKGRRQATSMAATLLQSVQTHIYDHLQPVEIRRLDDALRTLRDAAQGHLDLDQQ